MVRFEDEDRTDTEETEEQKEKREQEEREERIRAEIQNQEYRKRLLAKTGPAATAAKDSS